MWFIALTVPTSIDENQLVVRCQSIDYSQSSPDIQIPRCSVNQHQGLTFPFDFKPDFHSIVIYIGHFDVLHDYTVMPTFLHESVDVAHASKPSSIFI